MKIHSATFKCGLKGSHDILHDGTPQVAFIGRSNVGKSSLLNSLTNNKGLARTSKTPGRTQEINVFLINDSHYFMDLPGYGYAKLSGTAREKLYKLINWYLFAVDLDQKVVVLIDAEIGPTPDDLEMLRSLEMAGKQIVIVLNKIDKIKKSQYRTHIEKLARQFNGHKVFPYSSKTKQGRPELIHELLAESQPSQLS